VVRSRQRPSRPEGGGRRRLISRRPTPAGERQHGIGGTADPAGGAEGLAHLGRPATIGPVREDAPDGRSEGLGRDGGLGQEQARAELFDSFLARISRIG
jgi:hypothetical protein